MARLVVYGRSGYCPDMMRWERWVREHPLAYVLFDIDIDDAARAFVEQHTGHRSVPTLVIADDDGFEPVPPPEPLVGGPRDIDRGSMLTEPRPATLEAFLRRNGIAFGGPGGDPAIVETHLEHAGRHRAPIGRLPEA